MRLSPSNHHDRDSLITTEGLHLVVNNTDRVAGCASHAAMDDTAEWAEQNAGTVRHAGCTGDCIDGVSPGDCTCGHSLAWRAPRQPRHKPSRRSRWGRVMRELVSWLLSPTAFKRRR